MLNILESHRAMPTNSNPEYMREWRKTEAGVRAGERQRLKQRARDKAFRELAERHVVEFAILNNKHLRAELAKWAQANPGLTISQ